MRSGGGSLDLPEGGTASTTLHTPPSDQDLVITDLVFAIHSSRHNCAPESWEVEIVSDGETLGHFTVWAAYEQNKYTGYVYTWNYSEGRQVSLQSGLRIPAGAEAQLATSSLVDGCGSRTAALKWTWSGYLAQP